MQPLNAQLQTLYDAVPYSNSPTGMSRPDNLAAIATLAGMDPAPVQQCRVLDIGCAAGHNLLPIAESLPNSWFLGIDLSPRQIETGLQFIRQTGASNVELRCQDLMDFTDAGPFDYVIAHGFYSWVPLEVRDRALDICRRCLSSGGLAYISYNTLPGWHLKRISRDMMLFHARNQTDLRARESHAREIVALAAEVPAGRPEYLTALKQLARQVAGSPSWSMLHDDLGIVNEPVYFEQFIRHIQSHGLRYVGAASVTMELFRFLPVSLQEKLQQYAAGDWVAREQYMDFLVGPTFRASVLCLADAPQSPERGGPAAVKQMFAAAQLIQEPAAPGGGGVGFAHAIHPEKRLTLTNPASIAAFHRIKDAWPRALAFDQLHQSADGSTAQAVAQDVLLAYQISMLELWTRPTDFIGVASATTPADRPRTTPLIRLQASAGQPFANLRHESMTLDAASLPLLQLLDGTRDRSAIRKELARQLDRGEWRPDIRKGVPLNRADLYGYLDHKLSVFAAASLLLA